MRRKACRRHSVRFPPRIYVIEVMLGHRGKREVLSRRVVAPLQRNWPKHHCCSGWFVCWKYHAENAAVDLSKSQVCCRCITINQSNMSMELFSKRAKMADFFPGDILCVFARCLEGSAPHPWSHVDCQINKGSICAQDSREYEARRRQKKNNKTHTNPVYNIWCNIRNQTIRVMILPHQKSAEGMQISWLLLMEGGSGYSHSISPFFEAVWCFRCIIL